MVREVTSLDRATSYEKHRLFSGIGRAYSLCPDADFPYTVEMASGKVSRGAWGFYPDQLIPIYCGNLE